MDENAGKKECLRCRSPGLGEKEIICAKCVAEIFGQSNSPIVFCRKCHDFRPMDHSEIKSAEKSAGVCLSSITGKVMMVLDSCPKCYQEGDSTSGQFALLREMPVH